MKDMYCECIQEPRGDYGLEGYQLGDKYRFKFHTNPYHKDFMAVFPADTDYFETCTPNTFHKYFKEIHEKETVCHLRQENKT